MNVCRVIRHLNVLTVCVCVCNYISNNNLGDFNCLFAENEAITWLSDKVRHLNDSQQRAKIFIPPVLARHQNCYTKEMAMQRAKVYHDKLLFSASSNSDSKCCRLNSYVEKVFNTSEVTQDVSAILTFKETDDLQLILIEGDPGIGKTSLLKEVAFQWSKGKLLQRFKLVLFLSLRDSFIKQLSTFEELLLELCKGDSRAKEIASASNIFLSQTEGEDLVLLLDDFDGFPQDGSLMADILRRNVLPNCTLIISSRPQSSAPLQHLADVRINIWGFTEEDQRQYMEQAFTGQPEEVLQYEDSHCTSNSLCTVPYNMAMLCFLYSHGNDLPNSLTDLYKRFIHTTVSENLATITHFSSNTIPDLNNLPEPANRIVEQLSRLSFESINSNKYIFTQDEIDEACPDIAATLKGTNGHGLLQAVENLAEETKIFNFAPLIQEFLAAHYIAHHLSHAEELKTLEENFWSNHHLNVFVFYVALTNGQHSAFKKLLSDGHNDSIISVKFLEDPLKCFYLFRYFYEAGDHEMCRCIEETEMFNHKQGKGIELSINTLSVEYVTFFLTHSVYKEWSEGINFYRCFIQDRGVRTLHRGLVGAGITITKLWLDGCNGLTPSSLPLIRDIVISCKVKVLWIDGNDLVGEDKSFYKILSGPSSVLEQLHLAEVNLSSSAAIHLFTALATGTELRELWVTSNSINDEATNTIAAALEENTSLTTLNIGDNPITSESAHLIIKALQLNTTLENLVLPEYPEEEKSLLLQSVQHIREISDSTVNVTFW